MAKELSLGGMSATSAIDTDGWTKGTKKMKADLDAAGEGYEKQLRALAGRGSELHGILKVLTGGVVNEIGRQFAESTKHVVEMRDAVAEGKAHTEELARSVAESIPLVGGFVQGWMNLRELLTDDEGSIKRINEEAENSNKFFDGWYEIMRKTRVEAEDIATAIASANRSAAAAFGTNEQKRVADLKNQYESKYSQGGEFDKKTKEEVLKRNADLEKLRALRDQSPEAKALNSNEEYLARVREGKTLLQNKATPFGWWGDLSKALVRRGEARRDESLEAYKRSAEYSDTARAEGSLQKYEAGRIKQKSAEMEAFAKTGTESLAESMGSYSLGNTGRQSRFGGGIAYNGNSSGETPEQRAADAAAKLSKESRDFLKQIADDIAELKKGAK